MKTGIFLSLTLAAAALAAPASARADRLWTLRLKGGALVLSLDPPEERGRLLVFHRAPEGALSSLPADTVSRISIATGPAKKPRGSLDGQVLLLGHDLDPDERDEDSRAEAGGSLRPPARAGEDFAYVSAYGGSRYLPGPGLAPPDRARSLARPNGFPSVPSGGVAGGEALPIGPNGFPILNSPTAGDRASAPGPTRIQRFGRGRRFPG
ncbi:MAG: hypothetical protein ABJC07_10180 [Acidobacteriota bacterium]